MKTALICATYGRIPYLSRMLSSFVNQSYDDKQLIVVNDDTNVELCCDYPNVLVVNYPKRISISVKRNLAISLTNAEIILPLDDDDIFTPDRLDNHVSQYVDPNIVGYRNLASYIIHGDVFRKSESSTHNSISFKRSRWDAIGGYITGATPYEDVDIFNRLGNIKVDRDETKRDFIYGFGGVNYHASCGIEKPNLEQLAYKQLKDMNLLYGKYWIEPDNDQYHVCMKLKALYDQTNQDILVRHISDAKLEIL